MIGRRLKPDTDLAGAIGVAQLMEDTVRALALPDNASYRRYADLGRTAAVDVKDPVTGELILAANNEVLEEHVEKIEKAGGTVQL